MTKQEKERPDSNPYVYDWIKRNSHIGDWLVIAIDRGVPRNYALHLVTLYERLREAQIKLELAETMEEIDEALYMMDSVKVDLSLPSYAFLTERGSIDVLCSNIRFRLTGAAYDFLVTEPLEAPKISRNNDEDDTEDDSPFP